jgi:aspartate/methionine/tyrosine aminotransferase
MPSQGGFFLMGKLPILREYRDLPSDISAMDEPYDWKYLRYLVRKHSVVGIPASPFFSRNDYDVHYNMPSLARFAFCKRDDTLLEAKNRLSTVPKGHAMVNNNSLIG